MNSALYRLYVLGLQVELNFIQCLGKASLHLLCVPDSFNLFCMVYVVGFRSSGQACVY